jgi:chromosome segregation ATPase
VATVLEDPSFLSAGIKQLTESNNGHCKESSTLDKEIAKIQKRLSNYDEQEQNLIKLFRYAELNAEKITCETNQLKRDRQSDQEQLANLHKAKDQLQNLKKAEMKLNEYCDRAKQYLSQCSFEDKRLLLTDLDTKIMATHDDINIRIALPLEITATQPSDNFIATEQTWASLLRVTYDLAENDLVSLLLLLI